MFLDGLIKLLRSPLDLIRSKIFGVGAIQGGAQGNLRRLKDVGGSYKQAVKDAKGAAGKVKGAQAQAQAAQGQAQAAAGKVPKKKMGLFSKKKKCEGCGQKLHVSWDQCPYCGAGAAQSAPQAPAPVMAAPMPSSGGKQKTMAIDIGGSQQIVTGQSGSGWLVPLEGPQTGELFQLGSRSIVGTAPDCNIVLRDPSISGRHAEITLAGRGYRINDLGSTNGTFVNDKRVTSEDLIDNDSVRLGRTNFKFKSMS